MADMSRSYCVRRPSPEETRRVMLCRWPRMGCGEPGGGAVSLRYGGGLSLSAQMEGQLTIELTSRRLQ